MGRIIARGITFCASLARSRMITSDVIARFCLITYSIFEIIALTSF